MVEYQNIFTQVQVQGPPEWGMDDSGQLARDRVPSAGFSSLVWIG